MKMTRITLPIIATSLALTVPAVQAQSPTDPEISPYIGGGLGYYRLDDDDFLDEDDNLKDDQYSWRLLGGVEFNRIFGLEAGYVDFGETEDGTFTMDADGWTFAATVAIPFSDYIAPYAKIGQLYWDRTQKIDGIDSVRYTDDDNDMFYGAGLRLGLTERVDLRLEYERFTLDNTDLDMASANLVLRF